ncbi:hypothetical protein SNEBB_004601 [Seison nebaliae]|nr:hypothetical protein SNEBB_004601 [Seison nebaliae]
MSSRTSSKNEMDHITTIPGIPGIPKEALAEHRRQHMSAMTFQEADVNRNGKLTVEEMRQGGITPSNYSFDNEGKVSFQTFMKID